MSEKGAKKMAVNMGDEEDLNERGQLPAFFSADCSRKDNNWACGAYLMHYMDSVITEIVLPVSFLFAHCWYVRYY